MFDWQLSQSSLESEEFNMTMDINESNRILLEEKVNEGTLLRRQMLRAALVVGASMLLPITFFGCDSKKSSTSNSTGPANSPAPNKDSAAQDTVKKASQASMQYQPQPKGEQKCSLCLHFVAESNTCKVVEGQISPEGWCLLWTKKA